MSGVFDKFQKEERDKMIRLGMKIAQMHMEGKSIEEIEKQTNVSKKLLKEVLESVFEEVE